GDESAEAAVTASAEPGGESFVPVGGDLAALRKAAAGCRGCELWDSATQMRPAQSLLGARFSAMQNRGVVESPLAGAPTVVATVHPSAILRGPDEERDTRLKDLAADLRLA